MKCCEKYQNVTQRHEMSQGCWKNDTNTLAPCRLPQTFNVLQKKKKKAVFAKHNKVKPNKMRLACNSFGFCLFWEF